MQGMLFAEPAILVHFKSVGIIFLVLHGVIISLLTLRTSKRDLHSHFFGTSVNRIILASLSGARFRNGVHGIPGTRTGRAAIRKAIPAAILLTVPSKAVKPDEKPVPTNFRAQKNNAPFEV